MDPKSNVKLSGDHFFYPYIFLKLIFDCFLSTYLVKTVDIMLVFIVIRRNQALCPSIKAWFIQLMSTILPKFLLNINNHI